MSVTNITQHTEKRTVYFDLLRIAATFAVVLWHVTGSKWHTADVNSWGWKSFNLYESMVRWAVPVFVMISGALFLNTENLSMKKIYKKNVLRMFTAFCAWSIIYYLAGGTSVLSQLTGLFSPGKADRWISMIKGHYHLWFVLMIAGMYICLPIIKQMVKDLRVARYFLAVAFVFRFVIPQIVSLLKDFCGSNNNIVRVIGAMNDTLALMDIKIISGYLFYFILGYVISKTVFSKKQRTAIYILGICGFLFTVVADMMLAVKYQKPFDAYYSNSTVNILFETIAVFEWFKNMKFKNEKFNQIMVSVSKWTFGAYLIHPLILEKFGEHGVTTLSFAHPILSTPVLAIVIFLISIGISALLNQIPIIKKYIV